MLSINMKLGIKNLRSLKDTGMLEINNFTFLLGKNSSGKSTFLRTFPLLRQSVETNTKGPILWYGSYVDFGDFKTALNDITEENSITFSFSINIDTKRLPNNLFIQKNDSLKEIQECLIELILEQSKDGFSTTITKMSLSFLSNKVDIEINNDTFKKIQINDIAIDSKIFEIQKNYNNFLPSISSINYRLNKIQNFNELDLFNIDEENNQVITLDQIWSKLNFNDLSSINVQLKEEFNIKNRKIATTIHKSILAEFLPKFIDLCDINLRKQFKNFYYMAPLRAVAERYYRPQDLNIEEVDFEGRNLALVLANLENNNSKGSLQNFKKWCLEHFNFYPEATLNGGNFSIRIFFKNGDKEQNHNITDLGFGFSQILPIITQIWLATNNKKNVFKRDFEFIFIIEQPELHLHPKMQGKLINALVSLLQFSKNKLNNNVKFLIETHSETIINAIGNRIYAQILESTDVNVYIFNRVEGITEIEIANYDSEGILNNWPYGFFDEDLL